jgi:adenylate kinase
MDNGGLVPDDVVVEVVFEYLDEMRAGKGSIFDGFPRTVEQAAALDKKLHRRPFHLREMRRGLSRQVQAP